MRRLLFLSVLCCALFHAAHAQSAYTFEVDSTASEVVITVTVRPPAVASATDSSTSRVAGSLGAFLTPTTAPFTEFQMTAADLRLRDSVSLGFDFGLVVGSLDATGEPDSIRLSLIEPGDPAVVTNGAFEQADTRFALNGLLRFEATGLLAAFIPDSTDLGSNFLIDLSGTVVEENDEVVLTAPLFVSGVDTVGTVPIDLDIRGVIVGRADRRPTSVAASDVPERITLAQNYPNPFNPSTTITFTLGSATHVRLQVFDALGRHVVTLVDAVQASGLHAARFEATGLPSGLYTYRLDAGGLVQHRTMVLLQ